MLKSRKHVFWEALLVSIVILFLGLLIGMGIESSNQEKINAFYMQSEISLVDELAMLQYSDKLSVDCDTLMESTINFANTVYEEAKLLEKYEESGKINEGLKILHKKYDLMRTLLWLNLIDNKCDNFNLIVYVYEYNTDDWDKKAKQIVWEKILPEVDNLNEKNVILLPIAGNQNITTLDFLMKRQGISELPAVIINNQKVIYDIETLENLEEYLS